MQPRKIRKSLTNSSYISGLSDKKYILQNNNKVIIYRLQ